MPARLGAGGDAEFPVDRFDVGSDGGLGDSEGLRHVSVAEASCDQGERLFFALAETGVVS